MVRRIFGVMTENGSFFLNRRYKEKDNLHKEAYAVFNIFSNEIENCCGISAEKMV